VNPKVDLYLDEGCGRCSMYRTPQCKVHSWPAELIQLRRIALDCGLKEELKWSQPCYTFENSNVLLVTAFKDYAALAFFKGALLRDTHKMLVSPGEHSQSTRQLRFTSVAQIIDRERLWRSYIFQAIEVEKTGLKVAFKKHPEPIPEELENMFEELPALKTAFYALTPGRQRGYILYFSKPVQSNTRQSRIEKYIKKILSGKGFYD